MLTTGGGGGPIAGSTAGPHNGSKVPSLLNPYGVSPSASGPGAMVEDSSLLPSSSGINPNYSYDVRKSSIIDTNTLVGHSSLSSLNSFNIGRPMSDMRTTALSPTMSDAASSPTALRPTHTLGTSLHGSISGPSGSAHPTAVDNGIHTNPVANNPTRTNTNGTPAAANGDNASSNPAELLDLYPATVDGGADLISWLFSDTMMSNAKDPILSPTFYSFDSPMSLHSLLSPPSPQDEVTMSEAKRLELMTVIPTLESHEDAGLPSLQRFLAKYWSFVHPQYPILHKPSFQADNCPPGLLWALILTGAVMAKAHDIAGRIAEPLRWHLFGCPEFHPPTKLWVIQSLVLLELYEKTMSNRKNHERAHIHHATTLQLLRRGTVLRGLDSTKESDPWKRWIELESAKRAALMAFVLDVFDATMFGHSMVMSIHEIRLSLPCSESLWAEFPGDKAIPRQQNPPVILALKSLFNHTHVDTGPFGRRVLLAGLLCIANQMQQRDLQVRSLGWGQFKEKWQDVLGSAYDFWKLDYDQILSDDFPNEMMGPNGEGDGKDDNGDATKSVTSGSQSRHLDVLELTGCTSAFYHLGHMGLALSFLDLQIVAGCPSTLNQPIRQIDYENSLRKVNEWSTTMYCKRALWHCVQFLKEMYIEQKPTDADAPSLYFAKCHCPVPDLKEDGTKDSSSTRRESKSERTPRPSGYDASKDPVGKRPNAIYTAALMLWVYGYTINGPENDALVNAEPTMVQGANSEEGDSDRKDYRCSVAQEYADAVEADYAHVPSKEEGHDYILRLSKYSPQDITNASDKHHTVGLLRLVVDSIRGHHAELVQEGRRLLIHCIDRSLGRDKVRCDYMFGRL